MIQQLIYAITAICPTAVIQHDKKYCQLKVTFPKGESISIVWGGLSYHKVDEEGHFTHVEILAKRGDTRFVQKGGSTCDAGIQGYCSGAEVVEAIVALLSGEEGENFEVYCKECDDFHLNQEKCKQLVDLERRIDIFNQTAAAVLDVRLN